MMTGRDQFCCAGCESMLPLEEAHILFRTGFFRTIHPLGTCKRCLSARLLSAAPSLAMQVGPAGAVPEAGCVVPDGGLAAVHPSKPGFKDPLPLPAASYYAAIG